MQIERESLPEFKSGAFSVTATPAQIQAASLPLRKGVYLQVALGGGDVMIGTTAANAANGFVVKAGTVSPMLYIDDLNKLWVVSGTTAALTWIVF